MAKQSVIQRELKRKTLIGKFAVQRSALLEELQKDPSFEKKLILQKRIQKLPRDTSRVRSRNRCAQTGRARGYFRHFDLSRHMLRDCGHVGLIPGLTKSSW
jgi:small subunit ribosomal protein S14|uniref:Small ribosomal subunit protein uS14c n=1 Tax=Spumella sp. Baekdong012001B8 TaxID=2782410 RepID=A0A7S6TCW2_9STRA|nr:ribosomal protein S14 [Spumella sp. Baekdong012001B8]QOU10757.1 ribosomal protein S14 [Spumella sp. Baekdong012001B8]